MLLKMKNYNMEILHLLDVIVVRKKNVKLRNKEVMGVDSFQVHKILLIVEGNKFFLGTGMLKMRNYQHRVIKWKNMSKVLKFREILWILTSPVRAKILIKTKQTFTIMKPLYQLSWNLVLSKLIQLCWGLGPTDHQLKIWEKMNRLSFDTTQKLQKVKTSV